MGFERPCYIADSSKPISGRPMRQMAIVSVVNAPQLVEVISGSVTSLCRSIERCCDYQLRSLNVVENEIE